MTRAEDRLYIAGHTRQKTVPEDCWYAMVERALRPSAEVRDMTLEAPEEDVVIAGTGLVLEDPQTEPPDRVQRAEEEAPAEEPLPAWAKRSAPAERPARPVLSPSRLDEDGTPARSPGGDAAFRRGRIVHDILQRIPAPPPADPRPAIEAHLARPVLSLGPEERRAIADEVLAMLAHPAASAVFAPGSMAEVPIVGRIGGRDYSGWIDRLAVGEETVQLVEFKTDRDPPATPGDIPRQYLRQIAAYRALLTEIYPGKRIACTLVWTVGPVAMAVPDGLLHSALS